MISGSARADGYAPIESPAMDSLPVFAATLDPEDGGCFTLRRGCRTWPC